MELHRKLCLAFLGAFLSLSRPLSENRQLTEYNFPVYTTKLCPRDKKEWNMRSSAFNCTEGHSYACFPNDDITVLIEFCYPLPIIAITKDVCLFLSLKRGSRIDSFNCTAFLDGCPKKPYRASTIYDYPNCVSIGNGCFTAEPNCQSSTQKYIEETSTYSTHKKNMTNNKRIKIQQNGLYIFVIFATMVAILGISGVLFRLFKTRGPKALPVFLIRNFPTSSTNQTVQNQVAFASKPKPKHENKPEGNQNAGSLKENERDGSIIYQREERNEDQELHDTDLEVDAFPTSSTNQTVQNQVAFASKPKPKHENKPEGNQNAGSLKENERDGSIIYQREERNEDQELHDTDLEVDAFPTSSTNQTVQNQVAFEIHDVLILHAKEDDTLAKDFKQDLLSNMEMPDLNVVLYEEFAPDVQSHFKSMEIVFQRCRYLFVVVTKNFKHDNLKKFQNEMALMDSLRNPTNKGRIIPVWAERGAQQFLGELAVFKGIEYMPRSQFSKEEKDTVFKTIKNLFDCGKQINYLCD